MNLLAHLYLADRTRTSASGQILGDVIKGRLDETRYGLDVRHGIRLHRAIDRFSDGHPAHLALRRLFAPPLRRYAGILVDIGLDHSLALDWRAHTDCTLADFARIAELRVRHQWPDDAPFPAARMNGLARILTGYASPPGIQRALDSVARRLKRDNPVAAAWPSMVAHRRAFDKQLPRLLADLDTMVTEKAALLYEHTR